MVQVLPRFDPARDIGQSFGSGLGDVLGLLGQRQMATSALENLKNKDFSGMSAPEVFASLAQATTGIPHLQKQASELTQLILQNERAKQAAESLQRGQRVAQGQGFPQADNLQVAPQVQEALASLSMGKDTLPVARGQQGQQAQQGYVPFQSGGLQEVPETKDRYGAAGLLTPEETQYVIQQELSSGLATPETIRNAIDRAQENKLRSRELGIQESEVLQKELQMKRGLEKELSQNVLANTQKLLQSKGFESEVNNPEWERLSYDYFQSERAKDQRLAKEAAAKGKEYKGKPDLKLWQDAERRLERKIEDMAKGLENYGRPTFARDQAGKTKNTQNWIQKHLNTYGNTIESQEMLKTNLMRYGWSRAEATALVRPMSDALTKTIESLPKMPEAPLQMTELQAAMGGEQYEQKRQEYLDKVAQRIGKNFKKQDSLYLLKNRLVRDKGFSNKDALALVNQMLDKNQKEPLRLSDHQIAEMSYLNENVIPSLIDLFMEDRSVKEWMEPLIK